MEVKLAVRTKGAERGHEAADAQSASPRCSPEALRVDDDTLELGELVDSIR